MSNLKNCPFCGGEARRYFGKNDFHGIVCKKCAAKIYGYASQGAATRAWNKRVPATIATEINLFDKEEIHHNCTVQVWTNTATGQTSIGWWPEGEPPTGAEDK